ncbi:hypothetical protein ACFLY9_00245 [Patescibacteria group bacterium]
MISTKQAERFFRNLNLQLKHVKTSFPQEQVEKVILFAKKYSEKLDLAHDFKHIILVHNTALLSIRKRNFKNFDDEEKQQLIDLIVLSSLLHDCCAEKYPATKKELHHMKCAELAYKMLIKNHFDLNTAKAVRMLIRCHSTTGYEDYYHQIYKYRKYSKKIVKFAAKILYDADKLQTTGLVGILRAVITKYILEDATYKKLKVFNEKQQKKLKLKESLDLISFYGHIKSYNVKDIPKLLDDVKTYLEQL